MARRHQHTKNTHALRPATPNAGWAWGGRRAWPAGGGVQRSQQRLCAEDTGVRGHPLPSLAAPIGAPRARFRLRKARRPRAGALASMLGGREGGKEGRRNAQENASVWPSVWLKRLVVFSCPPAPSFTYSAASRHTKPLRVHTHPSLSLSLSLSLSQISMVEFRSNASLADTTGFCPFMLPIMPTPNNAPSSPPIEAPGEGAAPGARGGDAH